MYSLQSGNRQHTIDFPEHADVEILTAEGLPVLVDLKAALAAAFNNPVFDNGFRGAFPSKAASGRVAFVVTETVTPEVLEVALPIVLERFFQVNADLKPSAVTIIVGNWLTHSARADRFKKLFQTVNASGCRVIVHDPILQTMVEMGVTNRGTPVRVNSELANADLKIVLDRIKPCPLFGFVESPLRLARCCMSIDSIESLEAMALQSAGESCRLDRHPVFDEIREIIHMVGIDGGVAGISSPTGETIRIVAGEPSMIIRQAESLYRRHYRISFSTPFDIAVVSYGPQRTEPFLESLQISLLAAAQVLAEGGNLMILGDDTQGVGKDIFFDYICHSLSPAALIEGFIKSRTQLGAGGFGQPNRQNAAADRSLEKIFGMEVIRRCQFRAADPSTVLAEWADEYEDRPRIAVIPEVYGTSYYPD
jgi:nickel-dependent lactate racemase